MSPLPSPSSFTGPLFIVGYPRSGTKLIRDLLNRSPRVAIPLEESHFIPALVLDNGRPPRFADPAWRRRLLDELRTTPFFWGFARRGMFMPDEEFLREPFPHDWPGVIERVLRFFAPEEHEAQYIWGDKTPGYVRHIDLLHDLYPGARFIHILRHPCESSLSVRSAWGKSLAAAATAWREHVSYGRALGKQVGDCYKEIRYEELTTRPEAVLTDVCRFLGVEYSPTMLNLDIASDPWGRARGVKKILSNNTSKYRTELSEATIRRLEEITYPVAVELGYQPEFATGYRPASRLELRVLRLTDAVASFRFHMRDKGWLAGVQYTVRHNRWSSFHAARRWKRAG
jgi:hypothetical protein